MASNYKRTPFQFGRIVGVVPMILERIEDIKLHLQQCGTSTINEICSLCQTSKLPAKEQWMAASSSQQDIIFHEMCQRVCAAIFNGTLSRSMAHLVASQTGVQEIADMYAGSPKRGMFLFESDTSGIVNGVSDICASMIVYFYYT